MPMLLLYDIYQHRQHSYFPRVCVRAPNVCGKQHQASFKPILHLKSISNERTNQMRNQRERKNEETKDISINHTLFNTNNVLYNSRRMIDSSSSIDLFSPPMGRQMFVASHLEFIHLHDVIHRRWSDVNPMERA